MSGAKRGKNWSYPPLFGSVSTISRFSKRYRNGQNAVWSVYCLLFFYSRCPGAWPFAKVGARAPVP